jgi:hypothetical protein
MRREMPSHYHLMYHKGYEFWATEDAVKFATKDSLIEKAEGVLKWLDGTVHKKYENIFSIGFDSGGYLTSGVLRGYGESEVGPVIILEEV